MTTADRIRWSKMTTAYQNASRPTTNYRLLTFQAGVLGIDFRDNIVTCVTKNGQADQMGVRAGWRILEVGGEKVQGAKTIMKVVRKIKKDQMQFDVLFATPNWVKIEMPKEIGGGFLTMKVVNGTKVYQLKKQILKKCKAKRVRQSPKNGDQEKDMHHTCFVVTDGTQELTNDQVFEPSKQNLGTTRLVRISNVRESRKKNSFDAEKDSSEKSKRPAMISLTGGETTADETEDESTAKMEFVRVNIPADAGGGFITLRAKVGTSKSTLQKLAMEKLQQKRGLQTTEILEIDGSEMTITDSRVEEVMPSEPRRPRNNIERKCEMLINAAEFCRLKDLRITFTPGLIGIGWRGNTVTAVLPNSQAKRAGVSVGWEVLAVNGKPMPNNADAISEAIHKTKEAGKNTQLLFSPNKLPPGTEVILQNLKRNSRLNGMTAEIVKCLNSNKYNISILNSSTRISVRGISGNYFKVKHNEQFWLVVNAGGTKIYKSQHRKAEGSGYLKYDTVVRGIRCGDRWIKHSKGFSVISSGDIQFLSQTITRKYGVIWPLSYKRKEVYFQNSHVYDSQRRDLKKIVAIATKRQKELEKADMKSAKYTPKQWYDFWSTRNIYFCKYYKYISTGDNSVLEEEKRSDGDQFPEQISLPQGYDARQSVPPTPRNIIDFEDFDMITPSTNNSLASPINHSLAIDIFAQPADDPFAEKDDDPFAGTSDPFAGTNDPFATQPKNQKVGDPFADSSGDPFAVAAPNDPFADSSGDPFAVAAPNDPFADSSGDPFAGAAPNDPFADPTSSDPFADPAAKPSKTTDQMTEDFLSSLFEDTTLVSS